MNNRSFIPVFICCLLAVFSSVAHAQQGADEMYTKAKLFLNQGNLDSASFYLAKALELSPGNLEIQEDQVYIEILKRDFAKAISIGKALTARRDAGVKTFQVVGMAYKEIADYKAAKKMYEQALLKFPASGLLYAEFGDMYAQMNKKTDAIRTWEKGIEADPGHAGNYYFASHYYAENNNPLWAILYAETFVNIESLSNRTPEIKNILTSLYKKLSTPGFLISRNNPFALSVAGTFSKLPSITIHNPTVEAFTSLRIAFIKDWQLHKERFPFKLFEYHDQLIREGLFDAYNQWLFGNALNPDAYLAWMDANKEKMNAFTRFAGGRVYKVPTGQYYQTRP